MIAAYTTPFLRVALAANTAKKQYRGFTEADVTTEMIAPEIHVYATSQSVGGTGIANVVTIVSYLTTAKIHKERSTLFE